MESEINNTVAQLRSGKVILYPTDTIWGLGCDATNEEAIKKIMSIKKQKESEGLIILIADISQLYDYIVKIPEITWDIVEYAENPLTVVYPQGRQVPPIVLGKDGSIAIRLVKDEFCKRVIKKLGKAIIGTSANSGEATPPKSFSNVDPGILNQVDYVVNWRKNEKFTSKLSTIMKLDVDGGVKFIRK